MLLQSHKDFQVDGKEQNAKYRVITTQARGSPVGFMAKCNVWLQFSD